MKKEFSFYEFASIIVPSVTFLYCAQLLLEITYGQQVVNFSSLGETIAFLIVAYAVGHIMQGFGNMYEWILWKKIYKGMPSAWLTNKTRFKAKLFDAELTDKVKTKLFSQFGETQNRDYGRDAFKVIELAGKAQRAEIFLGNYGLFRGLVVCFLGISIATFLLLKWYFFLIPLTALVISHIRMVRFAKLYARDVYRTYFNL